MSTVDQYKGCFFGLALGDAHAASYEGGPLERLAWKLLGHTLDGLKRYTDDTQMSIDVATSFLEKKGIEQDHLAQTFAHSYQWSRGYGPAAGKLLKKIRSGNHWKQLNKAKYKDGSFGNGAAMRAPIVALCYFQKPKELPLLVEQVSEITHAHPLAIEGAQLIADATLAALQGKTNDEVLEQLKVHSHSDKYKAKLDICADYLRQQEAPSKRVIKQQLGNSVSAIDSCVTALYFALNFRNQDFKAMLKQICQLGGDADTIASMAGAIWGTFNGAKAFNQEMIQCVEHHNKIEKLAKDIYDLNAN